MTRAVRTTMIAIALAVPLVACRGKTTREECTQMVEHYLDLVVAEDPDLAKLPPAQLATVREMKKELKLGVKSYKKVRDKCPSEVTKTEANCALEAASAADWEACIK